MAKVLVIGNGFDLYHKLPTRYTDFLLFVNHWEDFKKKYADASIEVDDADMLDISRTEYGALNEKSIEDFAKYKHAYCIENIEKFDKAYLNKWVIYFNEVLEKTSIGKNWIDFEQEIMNAFLYVQGYFDILPKIAGTNQVINNVTPVGMHRVLRIFTDKSPLSYTPNIGIIHRSDLNDINEKKQELLAFMKDELDKLNICLNIYLLEFVSRIDCNMYSEQIKDLNDINLLNFNYTYTYKKVYGGNKLRNNHAIHGDIQENNLVLGIPDEAFCDTTEYIYFKKYFQRIQKRTGSFYREWITKPKYPTLGDVPPEVFIMGHSLAETDRGVLKDIFNNEYVHKITIFYHSQSAYEDMIINLVKVFGQDFIIENTANNRIIFEELKAPVNGKIR